MDKSDARILVFRDYGLKKDAAMELPVWRLESASFQLFFIKSSPIWDVIQLRAVT
jgi:hypothetical protein